MNNIKKLCVDVIYIILKILKVTIVLSILLFNLSYINIGNAATLAQISYITKIESSIERSSSFHNRKNPAF